MASAAGQLGLCWATFRNGSWQRVGQVLPPTAARRVQLQPQDGQGSERAWGRTQGDQRPGSFWRGPSRHLWASPSGSARARAHQAKPSPAARRCMLQYCTGKPLVPATPAMSSFGGARGSRAKPPEKGVFPLDHFGECKQVRRPAGCSASPGSKPRPPIWRVLAAWRAILQRRAALATRAPSAPHPPHSAGCPAADGRGLPGVLEAEQGRRTGMRGVVERVPAMQDASVGDGIGGSWGCLPLLLWDGQHDATASTQSSTPRPAPQ